jgi:AraC-like DNA-binding protein
MAADRAASSTELGPGPHDIPPVERLAMMLVGALLDPHLTLRGFIADACALRPLVAHGSRENAALYAEACAIAERTSTWGVAPCHPKVGAALAKLAASPWRWPEGELAEGFAVSRPYFGRLVHSYTGLDYRTLRRMVLMRTALPEVLRTGESLKVIAARLGFDHPSQFTRDFRQTFGVAPKQLRERWRAVQELSSKNR